jgi:tRNA A37 threonylcarbamoyladenosine dehydratase
LAKSIVAIAGAGTDGGLLAERLVRTGVGEIRLADPDTFNVTNLNRQFGADQRTRGQDKTSVLKWYNTHCSYEPHYESPANN